MATISGKAITTCTIDSTDIRPELIGTFTFNPGLRLREEPRAGDLTVRHVPMMPNPMARLTVVPDPATGKNIDKFSDVKFDPNNAGFDADGVAFSIVLGGPTGGWTLSGNCLVETGDATYDVDSRATQLEITLRPAGTAWTW